MLLYIFLYLLCVLGFNHYLFYIYINILRTVCSDKRVACIFSRIFWIIEFMIERVRENVYYIIIN